MKIYFRILKFATPYKLFIILSLVSSLLYVITNGLTLWLIGTLLSSIMNTEAVISNSNPTGFTEKINY